jgi:hypothetical protein
LIEASTTGVYSPALKKGSMARTVISRQSCTQSSTAEFRNGACRVRSLQVPLRSIGTRPTKSRRRAIGTPSECRDVHAVIAEVWPRSGRSTTSSAGDRRSRVAAMAPSQD